ncbi:hypothetical protein PJN93_28880, partial [Mycobacterium kansasii]
DDLRGNRRGGPRGTCSLHLPPNRHQERDPQDRDRDHRREDRRSSNDGTGNLRRKHKRNEVLHDEYLSGEWC